MVSKTIGDQHGISEGKTLKTMRLSVDNRAGEFFRFKKCSLSCCINASVMRLWFYHFKKPFHESYILKVKDSRNSFRQMRKAGFWLFFQFLNLFSNSAKYLAASLLATEMV